MIELKEKDIHIIGEVYSMKCELCGSEKTVNYCRLTDKDGDISYSDICACCLDEVNRKNTA
jgi:hypothetical protein